MKRLDLWYGRPWALLPEKMDEIQQVVDAHLEGIEIRPDVKAQGKQGAKADDRYTVRGGVAVIPAYGTLAKRANLFTDVSGGTSTELLQRDIRAALADPEVDALVLDIDSPGGSVDGTQETAELVRDASKTSGGSKPIVAFANGLMASAAYWIGSAADAVVSVPTADIGSIGVRMVHRDRSEQYARAGVKPTEIYAGKYKSAGTDTRALDEDSKEYLQSRVDAIYKLFVADVAANRGLSEANVLRAADGRVFTGTEALELGLVDRLGNLETAIETARKEITMTREQLRANHPDIYQAILDEGCASVDLPDVEQVRFDGKVEGAAEERTRCVKIFEAGGPADLTQTALEEGTDPGEHALAVLKAEREGRTTALDELGQSLGASAGHSGTGKSEGGEVVDFLGAVAAKQKAECISKAAAIRAVRAEQPELAEAYSAECCKAASKNG